MTFKSIQHVQYPNVEPPTVNLSLLWHLCGLFNLSGQFTLNWRGFMQQVSSGSHSPVAKVDMHPLIDLNPGDETCIYSTLMYIDSEVRRLGLPDTCITFDQPLWLKAVDICLASGLKVVCRLGGFHLLMSFLGCIGHVMAGSGLEDPFLLNYGPTTVQHMISGKAFDRALRGHFLAERALMHLSFHLTT